MKKLIKEFKQRLNEITWLDILTAKKQKNLVKLNEASLGRAYQHFQNSNRTSFAIVTAWRASEMDTGTPRTSDVNIQNMQLLSQDIQKEKLGFFKMRGNWVECFATDQKGDQVPYEDCPEDKKRVTSEPSYFVLGATKELLLSWLKKYNQNAGLYNGADVGNHTILLYNNGTEEDLGNGFHPNKAAQAFSKIRGKTFIFEYVQQGESFVEALMFQQYKDVKL